LVILDFCGCSFIVIIHIKIILLVDKHHQLK
jgi:hypothetical protein